MHRIIGAAAAVVVIGTTASAAEAPTGVELSATYTGEAWRNLQGGLRRGSIYIENLEGAIELDAGRAFGWKGASFHVSAFWNDNDTLSETLVGDLQAVSGKDAAGGLRLYEAWVRKAFDAGAVKLGVIDLNSELGVNNTAMIFANGAQGLGLDLAQVGHNGPSVFPATGLGILGEVRIKGHWTAKVGAFDGHPRGFEPPRQSFLRIDPDDGVLAIAELTRENDRGVRFAVGIWRHTGEFDAMDSSLGRASPTGGYALVEAPLARWGERRLDGFIRLGFADPDTEEIAAAYSAGVVLRGPLLGFEDEALGLGLTRVQTGRPHRRAHARLEGAVDNHETAVELTYRVQITPSLAVQPDVQYVINPDADPALKNAVVMGLRFEVALSGP